MIRHEPHETPPAAVAVGLGLQYTALYLAAIVITPVILVRAAGATGDAHLTWIVFATLLVTGVSSLLQAARVWRVGAGYPLLIGSSWAFLAVCVSALEAGGAALMATLICVSSVFQFGLAARLAWLRRIITPTVAGTVVMLIAASVASILFEQLKHVPEAAAPAAAPVSAAVTAVVIVLLGLFASAALRQWVLAIGLVAGCAAASFFGLYDVSGIIAADWVGVPSGGWPGLDLSFDATFWSLLPAFLFLTVIETGKTVGETTAVQSLAWRRPRATDFREVQGGVTATGIGNLLGGLGGTMPNTIYSSSIAMIELTGVASRRVGVWIAVFLMAVAFLPKAAAVVLAIPGPVAAAYMMVLAAMLFVLGMRMVVQEGLDYRKALIVGLSFWVGVGFEDGKIFADQLDGWWAGLFASGLTSGGLTAIALSGLLHLLEGRRQRLETVLGAGSQGEVEALLRRFAAARRWSEAGAERLGAAGEEAFLSLMGAWSEVDAEAPSSRRLLVTVRGDHQEAELEFVASAGADNLQDLIFLLSDQPGDVDVERELSLRLLRHYATSVRHQQYHNTDILIVQVHADPAARTRRGQTD